MMAFLSVVVPVLCVTILGCIWVWSKDRHAQREHEKLLHSAELEAQSAQVPVPREGPDTVELIRAVTEAMVAQAAAVNPPTPIIQTESTPPPADEQFTTIFPFFEETPDPTDGILPDLNDPYDNPSRTALIRPGEMSEILGLEQESGLSLEDRIGRAFDGR